MALVGKILQCLAIVFAAVLFAGAFDVFHIGLNAVVAPFAIVPIALFAIFALAGDFLDPGSAASEPGEDEEGEDRLKELQSKLISRVTALQTQVDGLSGQDRDALEEENRQLKEQLEAIQQAERDKVTSDAEALRLRNEELENQIKQWAIKAVGDTVGGDTAADKESKAA